jgi:hypothetical protein
MTRTRLALVASASALTIVQACCFGARQAQAQFVCVGNGNGATVPTTATASGEPQQINFDLLFQDVSNQWRLFGIAINTPDAPVAGR